MKVAFFGDSITADNDGKYHILGFMSYFPKDIYSANFGVRGATLDDIENVIYNNKHLKDYDVFVISGGTNDFLNNIPAVESENSLLRVVSYLQKYYPDKFIILTIPPKGWKVVDGELEVIPYPEYYEEVSKLFSIPIVNWYRNSGLSIYNADELYTDTVNDGFIVHPNSLGHRKLAQCLLKELIPCLQVIHR